jgi:glycosyltransferase involved in cell wall biosynthesis
MKISIVVPAYNEEKYLPATLAAVQEALSSIEDAEVIVVDNESTDATPEIAKKFEADVITEPEHNIGQVRNTGAQNSSGDVIVFLDADTRVAPGVFKKIIAAMTDTRCVGGSVAVEYETPRRMWVRAFMKLWVVLGRFTKMRQGALQFCRSDVFRELGGYDATIYVGEDIDFHWRLDKLAKRRGGHTAFVEEPKVVTSSRRWDKMGLRMLVLGHPVTIFMLWRVRSVWKDWYGDAVR